MINLKFDYLIISNFFEAREFYFGANFDFSFFFQNIDFS